MSVLEVTMSHPWAFQNSRSPDKVEIRIGSATASVNEIENAQGNNMAEESTSGGNFGRIVVGKQGGK